MQNVELPAGGLESTDKDYTIRVRRSYVTPEQFSPASDHHRRAAAAAATAGGPAEYVTRLGDVARIEEGADEPRRMFRRNGIDMVGMGLTRQSNANDLEISKEVRKTMEELKPTLPKAPDHVDHPRRLRLHARGDPRGLVHHGPVGGCWWPWSTSSSWAAGARRSSPRSWPRSRILATFMVLAPLGFSINLLTLLALVLAIGLVVDDAIVVVENIQRRLDDGEERWSPPSAAPSRCSSRSSPPPSC